MNIPSDYCNTMMNILTTLKYSTTSIPEPNKQPHSYDTSHQANDMNNASYASNASTSIPLQGDNNYAELKPRTESTPKSGKMANTLVSALISYQME